MKPSHLFAPHRARNPTTKSAKGGWTRVAGRVWPWGLAGVLGTAPIVGWMSRRPVAPPALDPARGGTDARTLSVPHAAGPITIDGDTDDPGWGGPPDPARTGPFVLSNGAPLRPFTEARLVWGDDSLYFALYAADEDIRSAPDDDSFRLTLARGDVRYVIDVSPKGIERQSMRAGTDAIARPWTSGAHVAFERDGTLDDASDADEEWMVEMALPFDSIEMRGSPGERFGLALRRCDQAPGAARVCAEWGEGDVPVPIVLR